MSHVAMVIERAGALEQQLKSLGAQGTGLRERAFDLDIRYPADVREALHYIAQRRNAIAHGDLSDLSDEESAAYLQACERVTLFLDSWLARHGHPQRRHAAMSTTPVTSTPAKPPAAAASPAKQLHTSAPPPASRQPLGLLGWGLRLLLLVLAVWGVPQVFMTAGPLINTLPPLLQPFVALLHLGLCTWAFFALLVRAASPLGRSR